MHPSPGLLFALTGNSLEVSVDRAASSAPDPEKLKLSDLQAKSLRSKYTIYVVPMMNPDGVILGSYRCNMSGVDLNRHYSQPYRSIAPEVNLLFHLEPSAGFILLEHNMSSFLHSFVPHGPWFPHLFGDLIGLQFKKSLGGSSRPCRDVL